MIRAVIFDLDGTLVNFNLDVKACRNEVIKHFTKQTLPRSLFSLKETAFDMLIKVKKYISLEGMDWQQFREVRKTIFSIVESFELDAAKTTKMFAGVHGTLQTLRDMKLKIALCTLSGEKATSYILKRFNLEHFFDAVITREFVKRVKPHPAHLEAALDALKVRPQHAVLVGDSVKDMEVARKLEVMAIGVSTGISSGEELSRFGANYLASSAIDIPTKIKQLQKK